MQLRRKLKRLATIALSLVMALSCMPVGVLAEAATPTDLIPENMATPDEAAPEEHPHEEITEGVPTEAEMEVVPEAPATEEIPSEAAPGGGDDAPLPEEQDASGTPTAPETPNKEESSADSRLPIQAALDEYGHVYVSTNQRIRRGGLEARIVGLHHDRGYFSCPGYGVSGSRIGRGLVSGRSR